MTFHIVTFSIVFLLSTLCCRQADVQSERDVRSAIQGRSRFPKTSARCRIYGHPIYFLETFVDPERFRGTCYRAANWVVLGKTTGRGKQCNRYVPNRSIKEVLGYPLAKQFRELLMGRG